VKNARHLKVFAALAFLAVAVMLSGCKSEPELTKAAALAMIQAQYDATPPEGASIVLDDLGIRMGVTAKYWNRTKVYPNTFWADFTLTDEGKKAVKLANGGSVIQWRPESATDKKASVIVTTVAANHLKARDIQDIQTVVGGDRSAAFTEVVNLDGVPAPLQDIAHNPGNKLSTKRTADFVLEGGAWKLHSID
jgi:hypothetical protein